MIEKKKLLGRAKTVGLLIKKEISKIDGVKAVRGEGLLLGILLEDINASTLVEVAKNNGLLLNAPNKGVIRIAPALSITDAQVREFIKKFAQSMALIQKGASK